LGVLGVPLKRLKKGCFWAFWGHYGGIPEVFGEGPIGAYEGRRRKRRVGEVARADKAGARELEEGV